jgi:ferredoxin
MSRFAISFPGTRFSAVEVPAGDLLSLHLNATNSPLLFGCRAGLCGTCLIDVELSEGGEGGAVSIDEQEALAVYAPDRPSARLACQLRATGPMKIRRVDRESV